MQERVVYETTWVSLTALGHLNYASSRRGSEGESWRGNGRHLERGGQNRRDHVEHGLDHEDRERGRSIQENCLR
jgi:hypothetical protein